jgi:hypothetical protein
MNPSALARRALALSVVALPACMSEFRVTSAPDCDAGLARIRTQSLPEGEVGQPYSFQLEHNCSGGFFLGNVSWETSGDLPPGITLGDGPGGTVDDRLSGTPTVPGTFPVVVSLKVSYTINGPELVDSKTFPLVVRPAP